MTAAEPVTNIEAVTSNLEQLGNAFTELESLKNSPENRIQPKDIHEYFRSFELLLKKRLDELAKKEKAFEEKETEIRALVADRETVVAAKEQASLDRVQELKDAAVAAITEVREKYKPSTPEAVVVEHDVEMKVTSSSNGNPGALISAPEDNESSPHRSGEQVEVHPRLELTQFCESMDSEGLLNFIYENRKYIDVLRKETPVALKNATDPARLVLNSLEGFYPSDDQANKRDDATLQGMRRSCVMLMESMAPMLVEAETLSPETKQQAKAIADEWKPKLVEVNVDASSSYSLEAEAFLQLLATFRIASEFDQHELCKFLPVVTCRRRLPELCRSLGLSEKMPGLIEIFVETGRQINAVHLVQAFKLTESFPPVPILKTYLKDLRRNCQGKGQNAVGAGTENDVNARELAGLKKVVKCVEDYNLQAEYPLEPLMRRLDQLERAKSDRKRMGEVVKYPKTKMSRTNGGGYYGSQMHAAAVDRSHLPASVYGTGGGSSYTMGVAERYSPHVGAATTFDYQGTIYSQGVYGKPTIPQRSYYYPQDERTTAAPSYSITDASRYAAYLGNELQPSHQPYM
ncbi:hypothetical protein GIB67_033827 [Kingdonia uniflora]|uniref:FRIGIDA-like protein n=1 Tax=Kingdonia uniflora TaxID=39325 RepID=A0A7J7LIQ6_9MAGN|nr:hypothetical protein GIB67_033827 [Kingdonia uniflora]